MCWLAKIIITMVIHHNEVLMIISLNNFCYGDRTFAWFFSFVKPYEDPISHCMVIDAHLILNLGKMLYLLKCDFGKVQNPMDICFYKLADCAFRWLDEGKKPDERPIPVPKVIQGNESEHFVMVNYHIWYCYDNFCQTRL